MVKMVKELKFYKVGSKDLNGMCTDNFNTKEEAQEFFNEWVKKYPKAKDTNTIWLKRCIKEYSDDGKEIISYIEIIEKV